MFKELFWTEFKLFLREPVAVFFTLIFPFIPLFIFGTLFGRQEASPGFYVIDYYVPALISMVIAYFGLMAIPISVAENRDEGVLKRYRASPLSLTSVLASHIALQVVMLVVVATLIVVVANAAFDLAFGGNLGWIVLIALVGCVSLFTFGFAVVGLCSGPRTTQAVGSVLFFAMLFTSGAAIPRRQFPPWLKDATDWIPLSHLVDALTAAWVGESIADQIPSIVILLGLAAVAFLVARKTFRWSPS